MIDKLIDLAIAYAPTVNLIIARILSRWTYRESIPSCARRPVAGK